MERDDRPDIRRDVCNEHCCEWNNLVDVREGAPTEPLGDTGKTAGGFAVLHGACDVVHGTTSDARGVVERAIGALKRVYGGALEAVGRVDDAGRTVNGPLAQSERLHGDSSLLHGTTARACGMSDRRHVVSLDLVGVPSLLLVASVLPLERVTPLDVVPIEFDGSRDRLLIDSDDRHIAVAREASATPVAHGGLGEEPQNLQAGGGGDDPRRRGRPRCFRWDRTPHREGWRLSRGDSRVSAMKSYRSSRAN